MNDHTCLFLLLSEERQSRNISAQCASRVSSGAMPVRAERGVYGRGGGKVEANWRQLADNLIGT